MPYEHRCPNCGHDTLIITATTLATVRFSSNGEHDVRDTQDVEWTDLSPTRCAECGHRDDLAQFSGGQDERDATDEEVKEATRLTENQDQIVVHENPRIYTDESGDRWFTAWVRLDDVT